MIDERDAHPQPDGPPPPDELDALLRAWHEANAERAAAGRDRLLARLEEAEPADTPAPAWRPRLSSNGRLTAAGAPAPGRLHAVGHLLKGVIMSRYTPAAASIALMVALVTIFLPVGTSAVQANQIMVPDGGRLDALDQAGRLVGPCPLEHTDVQAEISGRLARVTLTQRYRNPYDRAIEAVYTFPLSHRGAVDRMTMTVGDRVVVGTVKERDEARQIYEAARAQGYVASLLEQERPNIFTQSIANIAPEAEVVVEISYVELLETVDGVFSFEFPMVVGPRYIPGTPTVSRALVPAELTLRQGVVLRGPARVTLGEPGRIDALGVLHGGRLLTLLEAARPIEYPGAIWWGQGEDARVPEVWYPFEAEYCDGARELGWVHVDGTGQINGRWFFTDPKLAADAGTGYAPDTNQVPDASRITPMPVRPPKRAGHDVSVSVTVKTGGPGLTWMEAPLHEITGHEVIGAGDVDWSQLTVQLKSRREIPNRDFVLRWRQADADVQASQFAHTGANGNFFTLMLQPPARVAADQVPPRELVFVLDTSGSMKGFPIEKAKAVMTRAIDAMRDGDTFNVITFAGHTSILWPEPRPADAANRAAARSFVESQHGSGGTEMMKAIETALRPAASAKEPELSVAELADLPADGRAVTVRVPASALEVLMQGGAAPSLVELSVRPDLAVRARIARGTLHGGAVAPGAANARSLLMRGRWITEDGRRLLDVASVTDEPGRSAAAMRIVMFLTDGYVGNDGPIIEAVAANAGTTRVFSFGIGNSVNRHLLDGMADAGRGEVEYVLLEDGADAAVERFTRRIETPVLTDIEIALSDGLEITDTIPPLDAVPDLFDVKPLIIHGRYAAAGSGTMTIRGRTGAGVWERVVPLQLPEEQPGHDVIATLWARATIDRLSEEQDRAQIVALGEQFQIMTSHTSFVAVEHSRVVVEGRPMLVQVPIELPDRVSWEGNFGGGEAGVDDLAVLYGLPSSLDAVQVRLLERLQESPQPAQVPTSHDNFYAFFAAPSGGQPAADTGVSGGYRAMLHMAEGGGLKEMYKASAGPASGHPDRHTFGTPRRAYEATRPAPGEPAARDRGRAILGDVSADGLASELWFRHEAPTVTFHEQALVGAITEVQDTTGVPFHLDWPQLHQIGIDGSELVSLEPTPLEVPLVLDELLGQVGSEEQRALWTIQNGMIVISSQEALRDAIVRIYDVRDLLALPAAALREAGVADAPGDRTAQLADHVRASVDPDGWAARGGVRGTVAVQRGALVITAGQAVHPQIETLLTELRRSPALERARDDIRRRARLARVLDERLQAVANDPAAPVPADIVATPDGVLVSLLTTDVEPATLERLRGAGLRLLDRIETLNHVVGSIPAGRLHELALLESVRRVEAVGTSER